MDDSQIQIIELKAEVARLTAENHRLRSEVCPDIQTLAPELLAAGLIAWGDRAIEIYSQSHPESTDSVMPLILKLHHTAMESRSPTQCDRIKELFITICEMSGVYPTHAQSQAMQAILDRGSDSTGPVAATHLNFRPWIKQEE